MERSSNKGDYTVINYVIIAIAIYMIVTAMGNINRKM